MRNPKAACQEKCAEEAVFEFKLEPQYGQGFYINENPLGLNALVIVRNESCSPVRLDITRYNRPTSNFIILAGDEFGVELDNIQTVGIFNRGQKIAKGKIIIIPNFSCINKC